MYCVAQELASLAVFFSFFLLFFFVLYFLESSPYLFMNACETELIRDQHTNHKPHIRKSPSFGIETFVHVASK